MINNGNFDSTVEPVVMFWSLIVAIASLVIAIIVSLIERRQSAKLNSINLLKRSVEEPFNKYLVNGFCEKVDSCKYKFLSATDNAEEIKVSFDQYTLVVLQDTITEFLGEITYLKYAIPIRFYRLNILGKKITDYIENEMLPRALFQSAPIRGDENSKNVISKKHAKKLYKRLVCKVKKFYRVTFNIYRSGL